MEDDDVIREVRAARDAFARSHRYDLHAMVAALRKIDEVGDRPMVRLKPREPFAPNAVHETGGADAGAVTLVAVPTELVSEVRALIARRQSA